MTNEKKKKMELKNNNLLRVGKINVYRICGTHTYKSIVYYTFNNNNKSF